MFGIKAIKGLFTVCRLNTADKVDFNGDFLFFGKTDEEISLVCRPENVPADSLEREDGWRAFRVEGQLGFSLVGIMAGIAKTMANAGISIFTVSTFMTDYVLVKEENYRKALDVLADRGYRINSTDL